MIAESPGENARVDAGAKRILLVEDDAATQDEVSSVLRDEGYEVWTSPDGQSALDRLRRAPADLIILDLRMPVMDGWRFRTIQRSDPDIAGIPVIAVSADASAQAEAIDADQYLRKPLRRDELLLAVERILLGRERQRLADALRNTERTALLGTVAAGVGHEINNPLTYILANLDLVQGELATLCREAGEQPHAAALAGLEAHLRDVRTGADRIREVVASLRWLSRPRTESHRAVDLCRALETSISIAFNEIRHRARLEKHLREVPPIHGDEARLGQVFVNLLVNAAQAIPPGATKSNLISVATFVQNNWVAIEVRDTGQGIAPELHTKIFEPFFTTKGPAMGTGLGLAISQNIVREHGGRIELESNPGQGSLFRVLIPLKRPKGRGKALEGRAAAASEAIRPLRVLVIDDDLLVLSAIERMLGGHTVVVARSAGAALDQLKGDGAFDAILCDLMMPEVTGMAFYRAVVALGGRLASRIVFMTGGAFAPEARDFLRQVPATCIDKPFTRDSLRAALATAATRGGERRRV